MITGAIDRQGGVAMTPWIEAVVAKYGWIAIGLTFGFAAKYALLIKQGVMVKPRLVIADLLILPLVALISFNIATRIGATGEAVALTTAFATVGADRLIKLLTERFWRQVEAATLRDVARDVVESRGELRQATQIATSAQEIVRRQREGNQ
jgi:hypothetical protein